MGEPTLTEALAARGYTHRKAERGPMYAHHIMRDGEIVATLTAAQAWEWLHAQEAAEAPAMPRDERSRDTSGTAGERSNGDDR